MSTTTDRSNPGDRVSAVRARSRGSERVPYPIRIRELEVLRTRRINPVLVRVTLGGSGLAGFESHCPVEHVRLIYPEADGTVALPEPNGDMLRWPRPGSPSREYTVRRFDPDAGELDLDVVLHPGGLAAEWSATVEAGARIHVAGPPGGLAVPDGYDRFLLAGDLTALPAIARWCEHLPADAHGWALVEFADASEEIELRVPDGVEVHWVHRGPVPPGTSDVLERAVREIRIPDGDTVYVWIAGEAGVLRPLRRWVRDDLGLDPADHRLTGYWRRGVADFEEEHD